MRCLLTISLVLSVLLSTAQTSFLKEAVSRLDRALVAKDTVVLKQLLHSDLSYGHSNAWVEGKKDMVANLYNGKITYKKIETGDMKWVAGKGHATVRSTTEVEYILDGSEGRLKLHVLQVWLKTNKGWQLLARQSTKI